MRDRIVVARRCDRLCLSFTGIPLLGGMVHPAQKGVRRGGTQTNSSQKGVRTAAAAGAAYVMGVDGRVRRGVAKDALRMFELIARSGMNPLLGDPRGFLVYERSDGVVVGCGQVRGNELASVVVGREFRGQGIGSRIVRELVAQHSDRCLYLLCLDDRTGFYERFGFKTCCDEKEGMEEDEEELPMAMRLERRLGDVVASFVEPGRRCVAMLRKPDKGGVSA